MEKLTGNSPGIFVEVGLIYYQTIPPNAITANAIKTIVSAFLEALI